MNLKSLIIAMILIPMTAFTSMAADLMTEDGDVVEDLGGGEYMSGDGKITQVESAGSGEYLTSSDDIIVDMGDGEYATGAGGTVRDMGDEGLLGGDE